MLRRNDGNGNGGSRPQPLAWPLATPTSRLLGTLLGDPVASTASTRAWIPRADLIETDDEFTVRMEVPGMAIEQLSLTVADDTLTVSGRQPAPEDDAGVRAAHRECHYGEFQREFGFPGPIDGEAVSATCAEGVLKVRLPKSAAARRRTIEITRR